MTAKESIAIVRTPKADSLDEPEEPADDVPVPGCRVVPLMNTGGEQTFTGQVVTADFFVQTPPGTDIKASDQVRIRGALCQVEGAPADYGRKGVLFQARRVGTD